MKTIQEQRSNYLLKPNLYLGGVTFLFLMIQIITGVFLYVYFIPTVAEAYKSLQFISLNMPYGLFIRTIHRYSAYGMIILCVLHMIRMYVTKKYVKPYNVGWISGVILLFITVTVTATGFISSFDLGSQSLLNSFASFFKINRVGFQSLLLFNFGVHLLIPVLIFLFLIIHFSRIARPKIFPPLSQIAIFLGLLFLVSGVFPISTKTFEMNKNQFIFEKMFSTVPSQIIAFAVFALLMAILILIPYLIRKKKNTAIVDENRCTGCFYCESVCPKKAIIKKKIRKGNVFKEIAHVIESKCQACGVCVGACRSSVIQLQGNTDGDILLEVEKLWLKKA